MIWKNEDGNFIIHRYLIWALTVVHFMVCIVTIALSVVLFTLISDTKPSSVESYTPSEVEDVQLN